MGTQALGQSVENSRQRISEHFEAALAVRQVVHAAGAGIETDICNPMAPPLTCVGQGDIKLVSPLHVTEITRN